MYDNTLLIEHSLLQVTDKVYHLENDHLTFMEEKGWISWSKDKNKFAIYKKIELKSNLKIGYFKEYNDKIVSITIIKLFF
jgi:hypothetical protein